MAVHLYFFVAYCVLVLLAMPWTSAPEKLRTYTNTSAGEVSNLVSGKSRHGTFRVELLSALRHLSAKALTL